MKTMLVLAAVLGAGPAAAQSAQQIVARSDSVRNPSQPFRFTNAVVDYVGKKASDRLTLTI